MARSGNIRDMFNTLSKTTTVSPQGAPGTPAAETSKSSAQQSGAAAGKPGMKAQVSKSSTPASSGTVAGAATRAVTGTATGVPHFIVGGSTSSPHYTIASQYGIKVNTNAGAGNCGVIVIHEQLTKIEKYKDLTLQAVRNRIADVIEGDIELFSGFIQGAQLAHEGRVVVNKKVFDAYVAKARLSGTYTDHPEWIAARRAFPELPPFVFLTPSATSHGMKLVLSYFGDHSACKATQHLRSHGVTPESIHALEPDVIIFYFSRASSHFESTNRIVPVAATIPSVVGAGAPATGTRDEEIEDMGEVVVDEEGEEEEAEDDGGDEEDEEEGEGEDDDAIVGGEAVTSTAPSAGGKISHGKLSGRASLSSV